MTRYEDVDAMTNCWRNVPPDTKTVRTTTPCDRDNITWRTKPVDVKVGTYDASVLCCRKCGHPWSKHHGGMFTETCPIAPAVMATPLMDDALESLRSELADTRAERDRYISRCKELEAKLERIRGVVR